MIRNPKHIRICIAFLFILLPYILISQTLTGKITDENQKPIPYASVFVKEARQGTTTNTDGVYQISLPAGSYNVIFRCLGFEVVEQQMEIKPGQNTLDITLLVKPYQIAPVTIGSKDEDPAYDIIRKAIGMAPYYQNQIKEFEAEVYLKGTLKIKKLSWLVKKALKNSDEKDVPKEGEFYLQESVNNIHFTAPDKYDQKVKMIRSNFPGDDGSANSVMQFANASFYQPQIGDIILPLSPYALSHYKYKYDGFTIQGNRVINKIKVTPKRKSKQLVEGYMYIADDYYNLHEVDFSVESLVGTIRIKQTFGEIDDNAWLPISHHYEINGKFMGNEGDVLYISSVKYSNIKLNTNLKMPSNLAKVIQANKVEEQPKPVVKKVSPKQQAKEKKSAEKLEKLLNKETLSNREMYELAKLMDKQTKKADTASKSLEIVDPITVTIDSSARKVDTTTWNTIRPVILNADEVKADKTIIQKLQQEKDTTQTDSLTQKKSNLFSIALTGKYWYNKEKKRSFNFSGLISPNEFRFNTVDGFVVGSTFSYKQTFASTAISLKTSLHYAFAREIPMGTLNSSISYSDLHRGLLGVNVGYTSMDFNADNGIRNLTNTISSLGFGRNYMKLFDNRFITIYNKIDAINGLEIYTSATYSNRKMLENNTDFILVAKNRDWYMPNIPVNKLITSNNLDDNKAFIGNIRISYTPFYHYRMYDKRKVMIYSNYPTFQLQTKFGVPGIMESNSNFVQLEASIKQTINTGPSNKISYSIIYGDFLTKDKLFFNDFEHFNTQIIPVTSRHFSNSYQGLNYYKRSTNSTYGQIFANYHTPYLFLKYLPFLSNRMWQENLHFSSLFTRTYRPYYEVGYSMSQIGAIASVGVFAGFEGQTFYSLHVKLAIDI
ncbi:MAG: DUF5686 and carboxypeptidase regulatory-like domain-containing protein [Bacteroidales bacterium]